MNRVPECQYDEMVHVGKDFSSREVVAAYDARHRKFRDIDKENEIIIAGLALGPEHTVADFGCGTGAFVRAAARRCARVHAVDISRAMLDYAEEQSRREGLDNISYHQAGFLTYEHGGAPLDAVTTSAAFHHLPDFWKQKALNRLSAMLKPGGRFFLSDVVFSEKDCEKNIEAWIEKLTAQVGPEMTEDASRHIRQEYSTFTWVLEGMLERAGFRIDSARYFDGIFAVYFCTRVC